MEEQLEGAVKEKKNMQGTLSVACSDTLLNVLLV